MSMSFKTFSNFFDAENLHLRLADDKGTSQYRISLISGHYTFGFRSTTLDNRSRNHGEGQEDKSIERRRVSQARP